MGVTARRLEARIMGLEERPPVGIWLQGDPEEVEDYLELGIYGFVTNTIILDDLVDKYGPMLGLIERYLELEHDGPVVVEIDGDTTEDIFAVSRVFGRLSPRVVMKIPCTSKGLRAVARLKAVGQDSMVTTTFSASQAVAAACAGAEYIAPFVGPTIDSGADAFDIVSDIVRVISERPNGPYLLGGIIRNAISADVAIRAGCDGIVIFPHTYEEMLLHPGTAEWNATFRGKWDSMEAKGALVGVLDTASADGRAETAIV
jgi:transaldolase